MVAAIFGLLGVLIGTGTTVGFQWMTARRADDRQMKAAVRLVVTDLEKVRAVIEPVIDPSRRSWGREVTPLPDDAFRANQGLLAAKLDGSTWVQLEGAVLGVRRMEGIRLETAGTRSLDAEECADFDRIAQHLEVTLSALRATPWLADDPLPASAALAAGRPSALPPGPHEF